MPIIYIHSIAADAWDCLSLLLFAYHMHLQQKTFRFLCRFSDFSIIILIDFSYCVDIRHTSKGGIQMDKLQSETVYTDRRGLQFMLGQIVSNAIKYSSDSPMLTISMIHSETADVLSVEDNGIGVKKYDLPYIFQKGFTGDSTDSRKKATGIGLYLVKKMADDLNLCLEAASPWEKGFKIVIFFPKLKSNGGK